VKVINKIDKIYSEYRALSWFHLQDYIEMHGQQSLKFRLKFVQPVKKFLCLLAPKHLLPFLYYSFLPYSYIQTTSAINNIQFITKIKLLHVSATGCHP